MEPRKLRIPLAASPRLRVHCWNPNPPCPDDARRGSTASPWQRWPAAISDCSAQSGQGPGQRLLPLPRALKLNLDLLLVYAYAVVYKTCSMPMIVGSDVRGVRRALGLSAPKFATVLGVHPSTVFRWEAAGDGSVPIEGIPLNVLTALRQRVSEEGLDPEQVRDKGREVSDALVVGGVLLALGLLIAFARSK